MLPINVKDGVVSVNVNKTLKLTPKQAANIQRMRDRGYTDAEVQTYQLSLLGLIKGRKIDICRPYVSGRDYLKLKPSGSVLTQFQNLLKNTDQTHHKPGKTALGQWTGVEIECYLPHSMFESEDDAFKSLQDALREAGVTRCSVKYDGSLDCDDGYGVEVTHLFNASQGYESLHKLCNVLDNLEAYVNDKSGLHVHLDCRHLTEKTVKVVGRRLGRALPVLKWMVDDTRHDNTYCQLAVSPLSDNASRYYAVNMTAWYRYQTVEVRLHGGTTNGRKIQNWIETLRFLSNTFNTKPLTTFQSLLDLGYPDRLAAYAEKRIRSLNPDGWVQLNPPTPVAPVPVAPPIEVYSGPDRRLNNRPVNVGTGPQVLSQVTG